MALSRRIRALLVTAAVWGAAWFFPGLVWIGRLEMHRGDGLPFSLLTVIRDAFLNWAIFGAIGGTLFAVTLGLVERRRSSLDALSMRRVVGWGAIGGAAFPLLVIPLVPIIAPDYARQLPDIHDLSAALRQAFLAGTAYGVLGALSAGASLRLARRPDAELPAPSDAPKVMPVGRLVNAETVNRDVEVLRQQQGAKRPF